MRRVGEGIGVFLLLCLLVNVLYISFIVTAPTPHA